MTAVPAAIERGSGARAIVFLHGIGGGARAFEREVEAFGRGARAIAWEMPGYGASAPLASMTFPALADALVALLDDRGVERAVVVGHSMGGFVAQELVARRPERVRALVLYATSAAFGTGDEWRKRFLAERLEPLDAGKTPADLAPGLVAGMVGDDPDPEGVRRAVASMSAVPAATYRAALHCLLGFDRRASLGAVRCPTLALAGARDRVSPPSVLREMARAVPGALYREIPKAGHLANLEQPAAFDAALGELLAALPD